MRSRSGTSVRRAAPRARPDWDQATLLHRAAGGIAFASEITALRELARPPFRPRRGRRRRFLLLRPHAAAADDLPPGAAVGARPCAAHRRERRNRSSSLLEASAQSRQACRGRLDRGTRARAAPHGQGAPAAPTSGRRVRFRRGRFRRDRGGDGADSVLAVQDVHRGFPGSTATKRPRPRRIAEHLGCEQSSCRCSRRTAADVLPAVQAAFDEPTAANSAVPFGICRELRPST